MANSTVPTKSTDDTLSADELNNIVSAVNSKQDSLGFTAENILNKNAANGYAGLDGSGKVAAAQLPSYVDDVLEAANFAALPATGETGKIYVTLDTNLEYRWSGSAYIQIVASPGTTDALAEGSTNKYFTAARVLASVLTGLSLGTVSAVTATDTILQSFGKLQAQVNGLVPEQTPAATGTALTFTNDAVYGSKASPETGDITAGVTGALLGVTNIIIHNNTSAPTFDSKFHQLSGSGSYVTGALNYIYCTYIAADEIIYTINQRS